jgi:hypothetical protein
LGHVVLRPLRVTARIFADNLPAPRDVTMSMEFKPRDDSLSVEKLMDLVDGKTLNAIDGDEE